MVKHRANIGCEVFGKGAEFRRPVLVINKISIPNFLNCFLGVPLSSKTKGKSGAYFYKFTSKQNTEQTALLAQIKIFDTKRVIQSADISITKADFENLKAKIKDKIIK